MVVNKPKAKYIFVLSVILCLTLTLGYVIAGGKFEGIGIYAYFILLVVCIGIAVGLVQSDAEFKER